jgi:hypothetical protein
VSRRVKARQSLFQGEWRVSDWRNDYLPAFHRNAYALVDVQVCLARDRCGQPNTQTITPLLDIENSFGHVQLLK